MEEVGDDGGWMDPLDTGNQRWIQIVFTSGSWIFMRIHVLINKRKVEFGWIFLVPSKYNQA